MIILSHPTGNANVRQAALALQEHGLLAEWWTAIAPFPDALWLRRAPKKLAEQLLRRTPPEALRGKMRLAPWREAGRLLASRLGWTKLTCHERGVLSVDAVYRDLDRRVSRRLSAATGDQISGVYAYEDGAVESFRVARTRGWLRCYDLPIGYWRFWRRMLEEETEREPEWVPTLQGATDSTEKFARKDEELRLADRIFVASSFTRKTLAEAPGSLAPVEVIPYGTPPPHADEPLTHTGPLRVLFVGSLGQRKGLSYLLEAVKQVRSGVTLTLIGARTSAACAPLERALATHRWIPSLPHEQILREMRAHDVLVFPSLFEGFGLVLLEALSQGLPVIATPHTGAPDVIRDGIEGFIVPIRSSEAIANALERLAGDRSLLGAMKHAAWRRSSELTWESYRETLATFVNAALPTSEARPSMTDRFVLPSL